MFSKSSFVLLISLFLIFAGPASAQSTSNKWNGKKCAVVLTYDDALNVHLDKVMPALEAAGFRGTFYLIGSSPVVSARINDWRAAAQKGHELGNHSLNHPCDGSLPQRSFVTPENDLSKYSASRTIQEVKVTNTLLEAIDGRKIRTFAYPCGDLRVGDSLFYNALKEDFAGARGVTPRYLQPGEINLSDIPAFSESKSTGQEMIRQVKEAEQRGSVIVFLFHGVGGEHSLNVAFDEHQKLINYLKQHKDEIWVAPMVEVAEFVKQSARQ
ncbi:polysaccharide deacetylase family protein [Arcticibacter sp. MXS-1]|uniref:polysaccharide deacetylase family protein n=1 Tax=Arcticibacter sp. MXS-1 TaxID=3341726 RepID=UPI0035A83659